MQQPIQPLPDPPGSECVTEPRPSEGVSKSSKPFLAANVFNGWPCAKPPGNRFPDTFSGSAPEGVTEPRPSGSGLEVLAKFALLFVLAATFALLAQDASQPNDFRGWMGKGGSDFGSARYPDAVLDFQQATSLNPDDLGARLALARAYLAQYTPGSLVPGNVALAERARAEFGRVIETDPRNMTALRNLGKLSLQEAQGLPEANRRPKLDDARDWFHRVIELDPRSKDAFYSLGLIDWLQFSPAWLSARTKLGLKLDAAGPLPDAAVRQELIAKYGRAIDAAAANLGEALEIDPEYADALATMSWVARVRADLSDSPSHYQADIAQSLQWTEKAKQAQKLRNPERLRVAGEAQASKLISKTDPVYPPAAAQQKIQGTVELHAIIDKNGHVASTQFINGPESLADAAQQAVRKWVYQPTFFNGQPVEVITYIDVKFTLP